MRPASDRSRLGDVLVDMGFVSQEALTAALAKQGGSGLRVGEILVQFGSLSQLQLACALVEQRRRLVAGALGMAMLCLQPVDAAAEQRSVSLTISARVLPRAAAQIAPGPISLPGTTDHAPVQEVLTTIIPTINYRGGYSVLLEAKSARGNASPALIDETTGARLPYDLLLGGRKIGFEDGTAVLQRNGPHGEAGTPAVLAVSTAHANRSGLGDHLTLVIAAN